MPNLFDLRKTMPALQGLDDETAVNALHEAYYPDMDRDALSMKLGVKPPAPPPDTSSDMARGAKVALGQTVPILKGVTGLVGATAENAFGEGGLATGVKNWGLRGYQEGMQKLQPLQKDTDELTTAWDRAQGGDLGALVDWAQYGIGYAIGQGGESLAMAVLGGAAGAAMAPEAAPVAAAGGAITGLVAKGAVRSAAVNLIERAVVKEANSLMAASAGKLTAEAAVSQATKSIAKNIGSTSALLAYGGAQELGSIYPEAEAQAAEEGRKLNGGDLARTWAAGLVAGGIEGLTDKLGVEAALGKVRIPGAKTRLGSAALTGAAGVAVEGGTEAAQTAIERYGAGQQIASPEGVKDIINSAGQGALGGGFIGGVAGAVHGPKLEQAAFEQRANQAMQDLGRAQTVDEAIEAFDGTHVPLSVPQGLDAEGALTRMEAQMKADQDGLKDRSGRLPTPPWMSGQNGGQNKSAVTAGFSGEASADVVPEEPFGDRLITLRDQLKNSRVRQQVRDELGPDALNDVMYYAQRADDESLPGKTSNRMLSMAEAILGRALLKPMPDRSLGMNPSAAAPPQLAAPTSAPVPMIGLDTTPTGAMRVDAAGNAAPETRADAINTAQAAQRQARQDGMTAQAPQGSTPGAGVMVGQGTLTPGATRREAPTAMQLALQKAGLGSSPIDEAAHATAATSPHNEAPEPTPSMKEAGNYAVGRLRIAGLDISIENPEGSTRSGTDANGNPWSNTLAHHYGYIRGTVGRDKDHVDVFVKPGVSADYAGPVFVVDQVHPSTGRFDEHKAVLGAATEAEARAIYAANYAKDWQGLGSITKMEMPAFKAWVTDKEATKKPLALTTRAKEVAAPRETGDLADLKRQWKEAAQAGDSAQAKAINERIVALKSAGVAVTNGQAQASNGAQPSAAYASNTERTDSLSRVASWVIREKATGKVIAETFDRKKVDALNTAKYEAEPIQEHLGDLNKTLKQRADGVRASTKEQKPSLKERAEKVKADTQPAQTAPAQAEAPTQPTEAIHKDAGKPAEPVTAPVVAKSLDKAARSKDRKPSEMKADLLKQIDEAIPKSKDGDDADVRVYDERSRVKVDQRALDRRGLVGSRRFEAEREIQRRINESRVKAAENIGYVSFDVPGDGAFKVINSKAKLEEFRAKVEASPGFKDKPRSGPPVQPNPASAGTTAALQNMVEEGDYQAALDYATVKGASLDSLKLSKDDRSKLDAWLKVNRATEEEPQPQSTLKSGTERVTQTEAFKRWFGESKVVDADGKPRPVFHGTPTVGLQVFDPNKIGANGRSEGAGFYFTTDRQTADAYGQRGETLEVFLSIKKPLAYDAQPFNQAQMRKVLAEIAKVEAEDTGADWRDGFLSNYVDTYSKSLDASVREAARAFDGEERALDQVSGIIGSGVDASTVNNGLTQALGYDGYFSKGYSGEDQKGGEIWVAFRPEQVKSATGNSGAFDPNNPDIRAGSGISGTVNNPDTGTSTVDQKSLDAMKDGGGVLDWLVKNAADPLHRSMAARLKPYMGDVEVAFVKDGDTAPASVARRLSNGSTAVAELRPDGTYKMWFRVGEALNEAMLLHESIHAVTMKAFIGTKNALRADMQNVLAAIRKSFADVEATERIDAGQRKEAAFFQRVLEDEDELLAYAFSSPTLRRWMRNMNADGKFIPHEKTEAALREKIERDQPWVQSEPTLWQQFVDAVRTLLGLGKVYAPRIEALLADRERETAAYVEANKDSALYDRLDDFLQQAMEANAKASGVTTEQLRGGSGKTDQTQTEAFKKWFGESKVVDASGEPLVVYHGTLWDWSGDSAFNIDGSNEGGAFFSVSRSVASTFADHEEFGHYLDGEDAGLAPHVIPAYLSIKNPKHLGPDDVLKNGSHNFDMMRRALERAKSEGHDGALITGGVSDGFDQADQWVAFHPEQIKSATGNSGAFDPNNSDIRSGTASIMAGIRGFNQEAARNMFLDATTSHGSNAWFNGVRTQYAKAQKHPTTFGRVFDAIQDYIKDTSVFANAAANLAPNILPKLETWRDIVKGGLLRHGADREALKAAGAALWQGTLKDKKVFTKAELRAMGLTGEQIDLYREARAAIDQSLDDLGRTEIVRLAGNAGAPVAHTVMAQKNLADAADVLTAHLRGVKDETTAAMVEEKVSQIQKLKTEGYAPLMRFGRYTLHITRGDSTEFFGMYESRRDANRAARELRADPEFSGADFKQGLMSQKASELYSGMPLDALELFTETTGRADNPVYQDFLKLTKNNRSVLKRLIKRQGIAGFSEDTSRVLASFVTSNARAASGNMNLGHAKAAAEAIPKEQGDLKDDAISLLNYVQNPQEEAAALRGLLFANFIGGSVASAAVNLTQPFTMTMPYLSQFGGIAKAAGHLLAAARAAAGGKASEEVQAALDRAEADGIVSPQEIHHLQAEAMNRLGNNPVMKKAAFVWGSMFSLSEQFNRRVTFIAAYNTAKEHGMADPFAFAEKAVVETQGLYNKGNKPNLARGAIGATVFTFKQFSIHYLEFLTRMYQSGPEGKKAVAVALAVLMLTAGAGGLPFADDLDDLIDTLAQAMGYDFSSKKAKRNFISKTLGLGDVAADAFTRGLSSLPGMPIDVSLRMGMGNLLPGTGALLRSNTDRSKDVLEFAGAAGSLAKSAMDAGTKALQGNFAEAGLAVAPLAIQNMAKSLAMFNTGQYRNSKDQKVIDTDALDASMKFIGFQPASVARESQQMNEVQRSVQLAKNVEAEIAAKWAQGLNDREPEKVAAAKQQLADWNNDNPSTPMRIQLGQILRRVKEMNLSRAQRSEKSAPRELRPLVREAFQ